MYLSWWWIIIFGSAIWYAGHFAGKRELSREIDQLTSKIIGYRRLVVLMKKTARKGRSIDEFTEEDAIDLGSRQIPNPYDN